MPASVFAIPSSSLAATLEAIEDRALAPWSRTREVGPKHPLHGMPPSRALELVHALDLPVRALATRVPTLDDVYLRLTGNRIGPE